MKLKDYKVELKDSITWGESKDIQDAMLKDIEVDARGQIKGLSMSAMREAVYKTIEIIVIKITDKEGKEVSFSREWMNSLSIDDGNKLEDYANQFISKKKE
jgi:TRAP-type uncharacterized transport system substrate-binding protein